MTKQEKIEEVSSLSEQFKKAAGFYLIDISGFTVARTNDLRREFYTIGVGMRIAKNTLIKKALEEQEGDYSDFHTILKKPSCILFIDENANAPAKIIKKFQKQYEKPELKGAYIEETSFIGANQLDTLVSLKSKNELIGEVIGLLQSPIKTVVSQLQSGGTTIAGVVKTLSEREK